MFFFTFRRVYEIFFFLIRGSYIVQYKNGAISALTKSERRLHDIISSADVDRSGQGMANFTYTQLRADKVFTHIARVRYFAKRKKKNQNCYNIVLVRIFMSFYMRGTTTISYNCGAQETGFTIQFLRTRAPTIFCYVGSFAGEGG